MTPVRRASFQVLVAEHPEGCSMFGLIWGVTARIHYAVRRFMPTNIVLDAIHSRRGLKWGVPAMLLAVPYVLATVLCAELARNGDAGWLNLLAGLFIWNALKFLAAGPVTLIRLMRFRGREAFAQRRWVLARRVSVDPQRFEEPVLSSTPR